MKIFTGIIITILFISSCVKDDMEDLKKTCHCTKITRTIVAESKREYYSNNCEDNGLEVSNRPEFYQYVICYKDINNWRKANLKD